MSVLNENQLLGSSGAGGDYNLENSLRFRKSASAYLNRTPATAGNRKTFTWSGWVKRGVLADGYLFVAGTTSTNRFQISFYNNGIEVSMNNGSWVIELNSTAVFRDPSAWYHIVVAVDTTQATSSNRVKVYVNNSQITSWLTSTYPSQNLDTPVNSVVEHDIGISIVAPLYFDGYLTEINFVDGQALTASDFGDTNEDTGVWQPKEYTGTYGTNGFYLPFKPTTQATGFNTVTYAGSDSTQSITGVGFSPDFVWMKKRTGATNHILMDTVRGGTKFLESNTTTAETTVSGLLTFDTDGFSPLGGAGGINAAGDNYVAWCWDAGNTNPSYSAEFNGSSQSINMSNPSELTLGTGDFTIETWVYFNTDASYQHIMDYRPTGTQGNYPTLYYFGNQIIYFINSANVIASSSTVIPNTWYHVALSRSGTSTKMFINGVQEGSTYVASTNLVSGTARPIFGTSGFDNTLKLNGKLSNLRIVKGTAVYTTNFTVPDSPLTAITNTSLLTLQDSTIVDNSGNSLAITNTGSVANSVDYPFKYITNTDGTITSNIKANPATGFSVVTYTGNGTSGATTGHGLSTAPQMVIFKNRDVVGQWNIIAPSVLGAGYWMPFTTAASAFFDSNWTTTSSLLSLGSGGGHNGSGNGIVAYCFSDVAGYQKIGSYTGTGASGNTVTTGFRPAFILFKRTDAVSEWNILDATRDASNPRNTYIAPNQNYAESTTAGLTYDFNDTGFTVNGTGNGNNASGGTYIYLAIADTRDAQFNFDSSGNKNNWTANNINSNASGDTTYDIMTDVPTLTDTDTANYATLNPLKAGPAFTLSEGNLYALSTVSPYSYGSVLSTIGMPSNKWYWEITIGTTQSGVGIALDSIDPTTYFSIGTAGWAYNFNGDKRTNNTDSSYGASYTTNDVIGVAFDADSGSLTFYKNNISQGVAFSGLAANTYFAAICDMTGGGTGGGYFNFGQRPFKYTPPTGFKKLNTFNLPDSSIVNGSGYMDVNTWTGNGTSQTITNSGAMSPDFVWIKSRSVSGYYHVLIDAVRGITKALYSNATDAENTLATRITALNSNGFTLGSSGDVNDNAQTFVGWQWKAGGTAVSNTDGTITSQVSANPTAGFSVVTYTGVSATSTIGHGLGVAPKFIITKLRNIADGWYCYHESIGNNKFIRLDSTGATTTSTIFGNTSPTSTVFTNELGNYTCVAYCFADVEGYSKFGSYTGNGSTDGPFVYTGFRPAFVMIKGTNVGASQWGILDSARNPENACNHALFANLSNAEGSSDQIDILSNGFKVRNTFSSGNQNNINYIYMAFAENPFKNSLAR